METYDVTLSFAGEDRLHTKELAQLLKSGGYRVFYDDYEKPRLWGEISTTSCHRFIKIKRGTA